jgi:hypothetical protein
MVLYIYGGASIQRTTFINLLNNFKHDNNIKRDRQLQVHPGFITKRFYSLIKINLLLTTKQY